MRDNSHHAPAMLPFTSASAELARMRWAGSVVFSGFGARIGLRFADRELGAQLAARPSPHTRLAASGRVDRMLSVFHREDRYWIYGDGEMKCQPERRADLLDAFDTHLRAAFAEFSRRKLFVHAGAVGWKGKAIVFPGASRAGKSTLIAELVRAGASYFSDEYAILDDRGRVHPFAKPLSLRDPETSRQRETPVEALGGITADKALPVGLVIVTGFRDGTIWQPSTPPPGEGALEILANAIGAQRWPARALAVVGAVANHAPVIRTDRGEASAVVGDILTALEDAAEHG